MRLFFKNCKSTPKHERYKETLPKFLQMPKFFCFISHPSITKLNIVGILIQITPKVIMLHYIPKQKIMPNANNRPWKLGMKGT